MRLDRLTTWLLLALVGVVVILGQDFLAHPTLGLGDLLAILAGVFYATLFWPWRAPGID